MPFPSQNDLEVPLLRMLAQLGGEARPKQVYEPLAQEFGLTEEERRERMDNGSNHWENTIQWVRQKLVGSGEIDGSQRGVWKITAEGQKRLSGGPNIRRPLPIRPRPPERAEAPSPSTRDRTPGEVMEAAHSQLRQALAAELLQTIRAGSPDFFENLVLDVLVKMGYGGTRRDAAKIGRSGDGGIDGVIKEDRLGLDMIYVQAKRWREGSQIGSPEIRDFIGALAGRHAKRGIFITTGSVSREARHVADSAGEFKVVLIDGDQLAELMIELGVGVSTVASYSVLRIDSDYFEDEGS